MSWWRLLQNCDSREWNPGSRKWSFTIDRPKIEDFVLLQFVKMCLRVSDNLHLSRWDGKSFFSRHICFLSVHGMMLTDEVCRNAPKITCRFHSAFLCFRKILSIIVISEKTSTVVFNQIRLRSTRVGGIMMRAIFCSLFLYRLYANVKCFAIF